jgi:hypothetical protein
LRDWNDVFDGEAIVSDIMDVRRRAAYWVSQSTYTLDEKEDLVEMLEDESIELKPSEVQQIETLAKMSERLPCDDYAPRQRDLSRWIRSFCNL